MADGLDEWIFDIGRSLGSRSFGGPAIGANVCENIDEDFMREGPWSGHKLVKPTEEGDLIHFNIQSFCFHSWNRSQDILYFI